jgi:hypothetical protein
VNTSRQFEDSTLQETLTVSRAQSSESGNILSEASTRTSRLHYWPIRYRKSELEKLRHQEQDLEEVSTLSLNSLQICNEATPAEFRLKVQRTGYKTGIPFEYGCV